MNRSILFTTVNNNLFNNHSSNDNNNSNFMKQPQIKIRNDDFDHNKRMKDFSAYIYAYIRMIYIFSFDL